jgi:hypothetical protein
MLPKNPKNRNQKLLFIELTTSTKNQQDQQPTPKLEKANISQSQCIKA